MVFELTPNAGRAKWTETVPYSFYAQKNYTDGAYPQAGVIMDAAGKLYGMTSAGGGNCIRTERCGTVLSCRDRNTRTHARGRAQAPAPIGPRIPCAGGARHLAEIGGSAWRRRSRHQTINRICRPRPMSRFAGTENRRSASDDRRCPIPDLHHRSKFGTR
jgi:hypothetical protein